VRWFWPARWRSSSSSKPHVQSLRQQGGLQLPQPRSPRPARREGGREGGSAAWENRVGGDGWAHTSERCSRSAAAAGACAGGASGRKGRGNFSSPAREGGDGEGSLRTTLVQSSWHIAAWGCARRWTSEKEGAAHQEWEWGGAVHQTWDACGPWACPPALHSVNASPPHESPEASTDMVHVT